MLIEIAQYIDVTIILYFIAVNFFYIFLLSNSVSTILSCYREVRIANLNLFSGHEISPPVTIIISVFNEEFSVITTVLSILKSTYKNLKICIVNDGSEDKTLQNLITYFNLYPIVSIVPEKIPTLSKVKQYYISDVFPKVTLIDKEHSGKSDSLNTGINASNTPLFMTVDADTLLEPNTLQILVYSMLSKPHTVAEGGSVYVLNGCKVDQQGSLIEKKLAPSFLVAIQICEYLRAFLFGRVGWRLMGGPMVLSGTVTLFEKQAVIEVGGYNPHSLGEDMEIILHLHEYMRRNKYPYHIGYNLAGSVWTRVPETINALWAQRSRWHHGLMDSLFRYKRMFFNPNYQIVGACSYPFYLFGEFLGPIIELTGYLSVCIFYYFGLLDMQFLILFFVASWGLATVVTMATALISFISFNQYKRSRDLLYILLLVALESFGFRQLLVVCRVFSAFRYFFIRHKKGWRTGFSDNNRA